MLKLNERISNLLRNLRTVGPVRSFHYLKWTAPSSLKVFMFESIGKSIKGLIMETEAEKPVQPGEVKTVAIVGQSPMADNQFVEALRASIKARPTALTALTIAAEKLTTVIPDSNMRLKAAFQMVKSEGRGVKELLDAITVHVADLESQKMQFSRAMDTESQRTIGNLQVMADSLTANSKSAQDQIVSLQDQITQLTIQITENSTKLSTTNQQIAVEQSRLAQNAHQFDNALVVVKNELENQRVIIQSALS